MRINHEDLSAFWLVPNIWPNNVTVWPEHGTNQMNIQIPVQQFIQHNRMHGWRQFHWRSKPVSKEPNDTWLWPKPRGSSRMGWFNECRWSMLQIRPGCHHRNDVPRRRYSRKTYRNYTMLKVNLRIMTQRIQSGKPPLCNIVRQRLTNKAHK